MSSAVLLVYSYLLSHLCVVEFVVEQTVQYSKFRFLIEQLAGKNAGESCSDIQRVRAHGAYRQARSGSAVLNPHHEALKP